MNKKIVFLYCLLSVTYFLKDVLINKEEVNELKSTTVIESVLSKKETDNG